MTWNALCKGNKSSNQFALITRDLNREREFPSSGAQRCHFQVAHKSKGDFNLIFAYPLDPESIPVFSLSGPWISPLDIQRYITY